MGKAYSAPVFQTVIKRYLHEFADGNTVYTKRVEKIFKQNSGGLIFKPEKVFGNPKVYISIPTSTKKNYRDASKIKFEDLIDFIQIVLRLRQVIKLNFSIMKLIKPMNKNIFIN